VKKFWLKREKKLKANKWGHSPGRNGWFACSCWSFKKYFDL